MLLIAVSAVLREVDQLARKLEGRQVLVFDLHYVRGAGAGLEGRPQLEVLRGALAGTDQVNFDGRVGLVEQVDLMLQSRHPRPEGERNRSLSGSGVADAGAKCACQEHGCCSYATDPS